MDWANEAQAKAAQFQDTAKALKTAVDGAKKIKVDYDGLSGSIESLGKIAPEHVDPMSFLTGISGAAGTIVDFLLHKAPPISGVLEGWLEEITGKPSEIEAAAKHWEDYQNQLKPFAAGMKDPANKMKSVWTGKVANGVCAILIAEDVMIDALDEGFELCADAIRFVGKILDKLRKVILDKITELITKILEKIGVALLASSIPVAGWANLLASAITIGNMAWDYYEAYKSIRDNYNKLVTDTQKEWGNLQTALTSAQRLLA